MTKKIKKAKRTAKIKKTRYPRTIKLKNITTEEGKCKVIPGVVNLAKLQDIVVWHPDHGDATITFPGGKPFGWARKTVKKGGALDSGLPTMTGHFPYTIHCIACGVDPPGGSPPEVIVRGG
jgi:hypothetical protein